MEKNMKKLVVYYTFTGNTREFAKKIARMLRADIAEIRTLKTYPDDLDVLSGLVKRETETGYIPQIYQISHNIEKYETIIVGSPVWCNTFAPAMKKFLSSVSFKGKTVFPFVTTDKSAGHAQSDYKKALRGAEIQPLFAAKFNGSELITPNEDIKSWVEEIHTKP